MRARPLLAAALASAAAAGLVLGPATPIIRPDPPVINEPAHVKRRGKRRKQKGPRPNSRSTRGERPAFGNIKSLMRFFRAHPEWIPPDPSREARMRHPWWQRYYRRKALRALLNPEAAAEQRRGVA